MACFFIVFMVTLHGARALGDRQPCDRIATRAALLHRPRSPPLRDGAKIRRARLLLAGRPRRRVGGEPNGGTAMNWDQVQGQWNSLKGELKTKWGKLTDDDLKQLSGKKDVLVGKLQERYGIVRDEAEKQVDEWMAKLAPRRNEPPKS
jgi:uncharacterized protein YjbJ (UPF0337 family)